MNNLALGLCLGFAFLALGGGAIHWARTLMTDVDLVQERHPMKSDPESTAFAVSEFKQGVADSGFAKYPLIRRSLLTAMLVLPLPAVWLLRDLGPLPKDRLRHTLWAPGQKLVNPNTGQPLKVSDVSVGTLALANPARAGRRPGEPDRQPGQGRGAGRPAAAGGPEGLRGSRRRSSGTGRWTASWRSPRSAPTSVARWRCTSSRRTTCCARATSRPSTCPTTGRSIFGPAARSLPQLPITRRRRRQPGRRERLPGAGRPELLGARMSATTAPVTGA